MKKVLGIVYWLSISILIGVLAYTIYIRMKPTQLQQLPGYSTDRNSEAQEDPGTGETEDIPGTDTGESMNGAGDDDKQPVAAPDFELESIDNKKISLSGYKGKMVFLNFWALSCPYCLQEMPELDKAHKELDESGLGVVLTVNLGDERSRVEQYMKDEGFSLPVLLDTNGQVGRVYGVTGIPLTFVIKSDGTVYGYLAGAVDKDTIMKIADDLVNIEE
jgi:peroxiredoxin